MCLAVPAQLTEQLGHEAVADLHGNRVRINTVLVPEACVGDWVLVHAGFAIQRLDAEAATRTWAVLEDLDDLETHRAAPGEIERSTLKRNGKGGSS